MPQLFAPTAPTPRSALPGPSRTITVEPLRAPAQRPVPLPRPAPRERPERQRPEPERVPAGT